VFVMTTISWAAMIAKHEEYATEDPWLIPWKAELTKIVREYHAATTSSAGQSTLIARRLQTYKETGGLPPEVPDDGSLAREIDSDSPAIPEVAMLPLDLVELAKRLGLPAPPTRRKEVLPQAQPAIARRAPPTKSAPAFMHDAGAGRTAVDPVPALIAQLSSEEPRLRAFAADELAACGAAAAPAVPALRRALTDDDPRVRSSSVTALGAIVPPDSEIVLDIRQALADKSTRMSASTPAPRSGVSDFDELPGILEY
ncbi:MAG: HEAT repeat domain-containing protein, partial [Elusimicrobiota bacterium]